jgi:hypothetical protein
MAMGSFPDQNVLNILFYTEIGAANTKWGYCVNDLSGMEKEISGRCVDLGGIWKTRMTMDNVTLQEYNKRVTDIAKLGSGFGEVTNEEEQEKLLAIFYKSGNIGREYGWCEVDPIGTAVGKQETIDACRDKCTGPDVGGSWCVGGPTIGDQNNQCWSRDTITIDAKCCELAGPPVPEAERQKCVVKDVDCSGTVILSQDECEEVCNLTYRNGKCDFTNSGLRTVLTEEQCLAHGAAIVEIGGTGHSYVCMGDLCICYAYTIVDLSEEECQERESYNYQWRDSGWCIQYTGIVT